VADIAWCIVRLFGGFWSFRHAMLQRPHGSVRRRVLQAIYYAYLHRYGAFIGHTAQIDSEPCFPHNLHGIFIAGNARIGRNCVIFQQVTIGANSLADSKGVGTPAIGDCVYVGAGAKIIGGVTVGNNCRIGANCVVTVGVPDNSIVVTARPVILPRAGPVDNRYFRWSEQGPMYFDAGRWILVTDQALIDRLGNAL
jgi:serine O-acetyltransferase